MGFFSKVWKGVKKTFKKIGKGIKKAFKSVGKFMGKIGILGTVALTLLTGGLAGGLGGIFSNFGATLGKLGASMGGVTGGILKGASWTIGKAAQFGSAIKSGFSTLTKGVTEFFGETAKYVANKIPGVSIEGASTSLGEAWGNASQAVSDQFKGFKGDVSDLFTKTSPTLEAGKRMAFEQSASILNDPTGIADNYEVADLQPTVEVPTISEYIPADASDVASAGNRSFFDKAKDPQTYIQGAKDIVVEAPVNAMKGVTTQALTSLMAPPDEYTAPRSTGYYSPFMSQDYGAVAQGLTPIPNDGYQDMVFAYDALGQQSGAYGGLYRQRLGAFA